MKYEVNSTWNDPPTDTQIASLSRADRILRKDDPIPSTRWEMRSLLYDVWGLVYAKGRKPILNINTDQFVAQVKKLSAEDSKHEYEIKASVCLRGKDHAYITEEIEKYMPATTGEAHPDPKCLIYNGKADVQIGTIHSHNTPDNSLSFMDVSLQPVPGYRIGISKSRVALVVANAENKFKIRRYDLDPKKYDLHLDHKVKGDEEIVTHDFLVSEQGRWITRETESK